LNDKDLDRKYIVSMRLSNEDRIAVRSMATRLFIRESKLYRFAIHHLLNRLDALHDDSLSGSDLLMMFLEFKGELSTELELKKHQVFKILNGKNLRPEKFVAMTDIELLLMPDYALRQRLQMLPEAAPFKRADTGVWMKAYLRHKYGLIDSDERLFDDEQPEMVNSESTY